MTKIHKTYQCRAYTSRAGYERVAEVLRESARLYNAALEEWRWAYRAGVSVSLYSQYRELTAIRADDDFWGGISLQVARGVLRRADRARQAFYRRVKAGETTGYPRFKSGRRWHTVAACERHFKHGQGQGQLLRHPDQRLAGDKTSQRANSTGRYSEGALDNASGTSALRQPDIRSRANSPSEVRCRGRRLDMGVSDRLALSTGETVSRRNKPNAKLRRAQRRLSGCRKGGHRWQKRRAVLANQQHRESVRNRNECHRVTTELVRRFGLIALEGLAIKNMTRSASGTLENPGRNVRQKAGLNRSITEQTWGLLRNQIAYKAEWAGREMVLVDPRFTSQRCSGCGVVSADNRQHKRYDCADCGMTEDADVNAARNVLHKALAGRRESGYRLPAAS